MNTPKAANTCDQCDAVSSAKAYSEDWQYQSFTNKDTKSLEVIPESATKSRIAISQSKADTLYLLVDDTTDNLHRLSTLKLEQGEWSYMGGHRNVKYDRNIWNQNRDVKVIHSEGDQKFDIQTRGDEVCIVWTDRTHSNAPSGKMTPLVYCFNEAEQAWKEIGASHRIGRDSSSGDIELVLPSNCTCPELANYYFVIVGRPAQDHRAIQTVESKAVVWFFNRDLPDLGWQPLGGESDSASIIQGSSRDAHLAIPGKGTFKCMPHAVVSDVDNLDGIFDDAKHLVFARFEPGTPTPNDMAGFATGRWLLLDQLNHAHAQNVKQDVNDFVFTSSGVPAVAWADHSHENHVYLSVWAGYATAGPNDLNGFVVAGQNTINRGAICPSSAISCDKPAYENPTGLSVDVHEDTVFIAITSEAKKKIYVEYLDLGQEDLLDAQWQHYESNENDLLPNMLDDSSDDVDDEDRNSTPPMSQNQIKLNCRGEVFMAHIVERNGSTTTTAAVAKNGNPVNLDSSIENDVSVSNTDVSAVTDSIPAQEHEVSSTTVDNGSFYCNAVDFPCSNENSGEGMVHVCHHSARLGYQTFCIPEADTEVLRFYQKDYCGPCVGGVGGVNML